MGATETTTEDGREIINTTHKPLYDLRNTFVGVGDNGTKTIVALTYQDAEKHVDLTFSEDVWIKEGRLWCCDTVPLGACADVEIVHPVTDDVIARFCDKIPLAPGWLYLDSLDSEKVPAGVIIRMEAYNASGVAPEEAPAAFKMLGILTLYKNIPS